MMKDNINKRIEYEKSLTRFKTKTKMFHRDNRDGISYLDRGDIMLMCPHCYALHKMNIRAKVQLEATIIEGDCGYLNIYDDYKISFTCSKCENYNNGIVLDPNIAPAISIFNKKGYKTAFCCEGHGNKIPYVYFNYSTSIFSVLQTLPITWYLDISYGIDNIGNVIIRSFIPDWKEAVYDLILWADSLPNANEIPQCDIRYTLPVELVNRL